MLNKTDKKQTITARAIAIVIAVVISACLNYQTVGSAIAADAKKEYYEIRIPDNYETSTVYPPYLAEELGFFEKEGVKPVFTGAIPPGQHIAAVVAGNNDVGLMHINRTIVGIQGGAKIKAVVGNSETTSEYPHMEFIVLENSKIKEPKDLVGKKIGVASVGGCNEYTPYEWVKKNIGLKDPRGQFELVLIPAGNEETALRTGDVDVVGLHGHPIAIFNHGGVRMLFDDYMVWKTVGGQGPYYFREDFIKDNPDAVRRFVSAIAKTNNWYNAHMEEAKALHAKRVGVDPKDVSVQYKTPNGIIKEDTVQLWIDLLREYGELKKPLTADQIYTNDFNEFVARK
jgi:ABC-type nitrate/sulfonate/bicarbonate transport system substrate-binding protein